MRCGEVHRCSSDLMLLWLWCRPAAVAPIGPLNWEHPCTMGAALKREKKNEQEASMPYPQGGRGLGP